MNGRKHEYKIFDTSDADKKIPAAKAAGIKIKLN